jgi:2-C-methyl-D-erythritol 4-phosphate cytidylyltransferase
VKDDATAIVVAAGASRRMGGEEPKQFLDLAGRPLLTWALLPFEAHPEVAGIVVVLPAEEIEIWERRLIGEFGLSKIMALVPGGERRRDSVRAGLAAVLEAEPDGNRLVAVHDGARPLLSIELLSRCLTAARESGAAIPVVEVADTLVRTDGSGKWDGMVDRTVLRRVQTPQVFRADLLQKAHEARDDTEATDDAQLVAALGHPVTLVTGEECNLKVTGPADLAIAARLMGGEETG